MKKFELTDLRLIDLEAGRREDLSLAEDPFSWWWKQAEKHEAAIQKKIAKQNILAPAQGEEFYFSPSFGTARWDRLHPLPLAHGVPDSERIYLTQAERTLAQAALTLPCDGLTGSEYLRRHPEMLEGYVLGLAPDGTEELFLEER